MNWSDAVISFVSLIIGYYIKYVWDKKFFLYKKKVKAMEKLKIFIGIFAKSKSFYTGLQILD